MVTAQEHNASELDGRPMPFQSSEEGVCLESIPMTIVVVFRLSDAKLLAGAEVVSGQVDVKVDADNGQLTLAGGHCAAHVAFDGSGTLLPD